MRARGSTLTLCVISLAVAVSAFSQDTPAKPVTPPSTGAPAASGPTAADASRQAQKASDAASQVEKNVAKAADALDKAQKYQKSINDIAGPTAKSGQSAQDNVQNLQSTVQSVQTNDLLNALSASITDLDTKSPSMTTLSQECDKGKLQQPADAPQQDVTNALAKCAAAQKDAGDKSGGLLTAQTGLTKALQSIAPYMANRFDDLLAKVKVFSDKNLIAASGSTPSTPAAAVLLQVLPKGMPALREALDGVQQYSSAWKSMKPVIPSASTTNGGGGSTPAATPPDPDFEMKNVQDATNGIELGLAAWFSTITGELTTDAHALDGKIADVQTDPAKTSADALGEVRDKTETLTAAQGVVDAWPPLVGFLVDGQPSGFTLSTARKNFEDMQKWTNQLRASISRVHDALAGDFENAEADQVSLYYFTDVPRLMQVLNGSVQAIGGAADAQAKAAAQRTALMGAELELTDAQSNVDRYQKQVLDLQEQQRQSQESALPLPSLGASTPTSSNSTQSQQDLSAKLDTAQQALSDAQTRVGEERRKMLIATVAESDAFAHARDNTPFLYTPADASSTDPAKRVVLFAFNDSKTVFMRGNPKDLALVKAIIANFDRPAPQARLTLWTFELNADSNQKANKGAADKLNRSMEIVDQELSGTRALENTTLDLLRSFINQGVRKCFKATLGLSPPVEGGQGQDLTVAKCAAPPTRAQCVGCTDADFEKLRRITFYDPLVLEQLGFTDTRKELYLKKLRELIPDPAGTTTLGEALMILALAPLETRLAVRTEFESAIRARLKDLPLPPKFDTRAWSENAGGENQSEGARYLLPLTWHSLDFWEVGIKGSGAGLTSQQLEIARALRAAYEGKQIRRILDKVGSRYTDLRSVQNRLNAEEDTLTALEDRGKDALAKNSATDAAALTQLQQKGHAASENEVATKNALVQKGIRLLPAADRNAYRRADDQHLKLQAAGQTFIARMTVDANQLKMWRIDPTDFLTKLSAATTDSDFNDALVDLKILAYSSPSLSSASPRVAAADEMLKEIIIALEDDLDRLFVQPMISSLRTRMTSETGVRVGILQRESMLASNRGKARVDPKASAQLAVGEEQDILSGVQQLAQLYATAQSGGALGVLGALKKQPREAQPEIYALTTGNKFEVTPIFDPSGQALRFKFDFVSTSNIQEPNGTTNIQMPRVDRHTVNTEVQLSNLETREISRFESNARLGLPTTYWGGIPILKDIPYVRPWVPLVGWFVRKAGSNASAQQSVIFGQTTMYPTIGAIIDLLSDTEQSADTEQGPGVAPATPPPTVPAPKGN